MYRLVADKSYVRGKVEFGEPIVIWWVCLQGDCGQVELAIMATLRVFILSLFFLDESMSFESIDIQRGVFFISHDYRA